MTDLNSKIREAIEAVKKATPGEWEEFTLGTGKTATLVFAGDEKVFECETASDRAAIVAAMNLLRDPAVEARLVGEANAWRPTLEQIATEIEKQPWIVDQYGSSECVPHDAAMQMAAGIHALIFDGATDVPPPKDAAR